MRIRWTQASFQDLQDIADYISLDNSAAAKATILRIRETIRQLVQHPAMGRVGRVEGTREHIVLGTPFLIAYRLKDDVIEILRVLHSARRWPS